MSSPQPRAVVDFAVDYLSWKNKASTNRRFVLLKSYCESCLEDVCVLHR